MDDEARYENEAARNPVPESSWGKLLGHVNEGSKVLEIGCAHGSFSYALKHLKKCQVVGVELDEQAAKNAEAQTDALFIGDVATQ